MVEQIRNAGIELKDHMLSDSSGSRWLVSLDWSVLVLGRLRLPDGHSDL